jgi:hypothetical protein
LMPVRSAHWIQKSLKTSSRKSGSSISQPNGH